MSPENKKLASQRGLYHRVHCSDFQSRHDEESANDPGIDGWADDENVMGRLRYSYVQIDINA